MKKMQPEEAVTGRCCVEKLPFKISQNSQDNTCARVSILIKSLFYNFIKKETPTQVFSCEFCEIFKNNFFHRTPPVAASEPEKSGT